MQTCRHDERTAHLLEPMKSTWSTGSLSVHTKEPSQSAPTAHELSTARSREELKYSSIWKASSRLLTDLMRTSTSNSSPGDTGGNGGPAADAETGKR